MKERMKRARRWLSFLCVVLGLHPLANAREVLRWGGDAESGVPHIFYDLQNPEKLIGFEYEIAKGIADYCDLDLQYCPNDWEMLVPGLQRAEYDILLNAVERGTWQARAEKAGVALSNPYFITHLQATVLRDSPIQHFTDCSGKTIGILKASKHAEKALEALSNIRLSVYDDEVKAYADLENKRIDCVLLDYPESFYYAAVNPKVRLLKEPIGRLEFSVMVRAIDTALLTKVNAALEHMKANGTLQGIFKRWGLWNQATADYFRVPFQASNGHQQQATEFNRYVHLMQHAQEETTQSIYVQSLPLFAKGAAITFGLSVVAMSLSLIIGFIIALMRTYMVAPLKIIATLYIECVRGTPLLIQLLFIFYGLPTLAPNLPEPFSRWVCLNPFVAGVLGLAINYSAYEAEIYRSGFLSVPIGQMEAARALGMTHMQALLHVVFPQAIRTILPPITNDFIMLLQDSSLVSMITIVELSRTYQFAAAAHFDYFGFGILVAAFYLLLGLPFTYCAHRFEKNLSRCHHKYV